MADTIFYIWLSGKGKDDCGRKRFLLRLFGGAEELYKASYEDLKQCFELHDELSGSSSLIKQLLNKDLAMAETELEAAEKCGAEIIVLEDERYPEHLKGIENPPMLLYCKGNVNLLKNPGIAVVGTRRASPYGLWAAGEIGKCIGRFGGTIVSGMAEGIDSAAHKGCLEVKGSTIAVFGNGIDICFPSSGKKIYKQILDENGLLVTEFAPGVHGTRYSFPQRNRIISGLSRSCIVVEGAVKSGSLITANLAMAQGRDVYAVPGNINQPNSVGVNKLIYDGAFPITDLSHLASDLGLRKELERVGNQARGLQEESSEGENSNGNISGEERKILNLVHYEPGLTFDVIFDRLNMDSSHGSSIVSAMELKGFIRCEGRRIFESL